MHTKKIPVIPILLVALTCRAQDMLSPLVDSTPLPSAVKSLFNQKKKIVVAAHIAVYGTATTGLYASWYRNYSFGKFHFVNDNRQWLQVDKAGHAWSGYIQGKWGIAAWRWTGMDDRKAIWIGGLTGFAYQHVIEMLDGFSANWGFSWGDYIADVAGSGLVIGQEFAWREQKILYKFSAHRNHYPDELLNERARDLYGKTLPDRLLNDYNAQTYWLSANLRSVLKQDVIPGWLNVAVGYGASGIFGKLHNKWESPGGGEYDRSDIKRYRQFYLSPDIDLTRIKTKSRLLKTAFFLLNSFKFPAPALEFSNNKIRAHWLIF